MEAKDLYGQLSHSGKPFNCGYYVSTCKGLVYFAEGEEDQRDGYLKDEGVYDEETPNWEELHKLYEDDFYYSEWFVEDCMDGGYDEQGNYYLIEDGKCIKETFKTMNKLEQNGAILSTDEHGNDKIQRIDNAEEWAEDNGLEYVKQLDGDEDAVEFVRELVIDNYIETIHQDLNQGDKSLLWSLLSGNGLEPPYKLTEQELITEAKELGIL
jgi:hypothetical protein